MSFAFPSFRCDISYEYCELLDIDLFMKQSPH
jgi:hypothetical protein